MEENSKQTLFYTYILNLLQSELVKYTWHIRGNFTKMVNNNIILWNSHWFSAMSYFSVPQRKNNK